MDRVRSRAAALILTSLAVSALAGAARAEDVIKIGIDAAYKPFAYVDPSGEIAGFEVDLVRSVCEDIKAKCELSNVPWDGIWTAMEAGTIDMIGTTVTETAPRLEKYDASSIIYKVGYVFVVPATADISGGIEGLKGKPIGTSIGTQSYYQYIQNALGATTDIRGYESPDAAILDLDAGRIAAYQGDYLQTQEQFVSTGKYKFVGDVNYDPRWVGAGRGWFFRKGSADVVARINKGIAMAIADGTVDKLGVKYFGAKLSR